jgi:hypothetical protein
VSATTTSIEPLWLDAVTVTRPPVGVNRTALSSRLNNT